MRDKIVFDPNNYVWRDCNDGMQHAIMKYLFVEHKISAICGKYFTALTVYSSHVQRPCKSCYDRYYNGGK